MAFNFTLSFEQVLQILKQADGKQEIGHLVSRQYSIQAQIEVEDCQKFFIPLRGEKRPIALYNLPNGREGDLLTYQEIVKSVGEAEDLVDRLYERFQKRTGIQIITTTVKNEHGDAVFQMGNQVAILPDASIEEIVEKLLDLDFVIALKKAYAPDLDVEGLQR